MSQDRDFHPNAVPNADKATIPEGKVGKYLLDPLHKEGRHKARLFKGVLGFEQQDSSELERLILSELPFHAATRASEGKWGLKYEVTMPITGPNGETANVLSVWIIRKETELPSLITARIVRERRR